MATPSQNELYAEQIRADPNHLVGVYFPDFGLMYRGIWTDETHSLQTQAKYSDILDKTLGDLGGGGTVGDLGALAARSTGVNGMQFVQQTILTWEGSERPQFTLSMLLLALRAGEDPRLAAVSLASHCLPERGDNSNQAVASLMLGLTDKVASAFSDVSFSGSVLTPPNGYDAAFSEFGFSGHQNVKGTCTVTIGSWFRAMNQVLVDVTFDMSQTLIAPGVPLYCEGKISFEPYRMISNTELFDFYPSLGSNALAFVEQQSMPV